MSEKLPKRNMDDGFLQFHSTLDLFVLKNVLNNLRHPIIKLTKKPANFENFSKTLVLNLLDITILLHENGYVETDTFYKETNSHDYLNHNTHHLNHIKSNIPYSLAKHLCKTSK